MQDSKEAAVAADEAAPEEKTDEQLWAELDDEAAGQDDDPPADTPDQDDDDPSEDDATDGEDAETTETKPDHLEQIRRLESELADRKDRIAGMSRKISKLQRQIAEAEKSAPDESDDDTDDDPSDRLASAREEFPDIVGPMADELAEVRAQLAELKRGITGNKTAAAEAAKADLDEIEKAETERFLSEHSDGFEVIQKHKADFAAWVDDQPRYLRDIAMENNDRIVDGAGVAYLVSLFKQSLGGGPETGLADKRKRQLDGGRSSSAASAQATSAVPSGMTDEQIWKSLP